ncbi:MAG TPA: hypothetical protein VK945_00535 [Planococcus sp. (in: firmicutes)]|nr:hypothetical protein [Planococcus sp. (in: firmicutes)]
MNKTITVLGTMIVIAALNWGTAVFLDMSFLDVAVPVGALAIVAAFFLSSRSGMASRHMDMSIQGRTGIRMERQAATAERSYVLIGSILYTAIMVVITFIAYREYFIGMGA